MQGTVSRIVALCLLVATLAPAFAAEPPGWDSGVAMSRLDDPFAAGNEAAAGAKAKLKGEAKFVMVVAAEPQVTPELVAGVAKHFPKSVIFGGQATSPLTRESNFPQYDSLDIPAGVAVWALGGDVDVAFAHTSTVRPDDDDVYFNAGVDLAEQLKDFLAASKRPGKVVFTWGDQYTGSNKDFAQGMNEGFGETWAITGAASGNVTAKVILEGEIKTGENGAAAICGDFRLGQSMNGGTHTPETADRTLAEAVSAGDGDDPFFALIFNCRRRRRGMLDSGELGKELDAINKHMKGAEFFGFYGPGEIGSTRVGEPALGMGFTVTATVFFPLK